jgi:hypothetical protein
MIYDYWYWENVYSLAEIKQLHNIFHKTKDNFVIDEPASNTTKKVNLSHSYWSNFKNNLNPIEQAVFKSNAENFGYNIWPQYDTNTLLLNEYDSVVEGEYDWHKDSSNNHIYDIKFTVLINVSLQPYEGGQFYIFSNGGPKHIEKLDNPGNVIMFKSHIPHKVYPVTKGKRHSITIFYEGPKFI